MLLVQGLDEVAGCACRFFEAGACELRIGVYESFDTLCIYLESDALASPERNFWVKYRIAVVNQRHPDRTEWKDSAICTKTWNNSVLQFMKVCHACIWAACRICPDGMQLQHCTHLTTLTGLWGTERYDMNSRQALRLCAEC